MVAISVESLTKEYQIPDGKITAVNNVNLEIEEGEFISLLGPSGCGKTTTLRCIAGLEIPTDGKIFINNKNMTNVPANKRDLAMMFQNIALYPHMSIEENISFPLRIANIDKVLIREKVSETAGLLQISELMKKYPGDLSGGQRQRVALARTVVQDPSAFLMDEPLSDLDAKLKMDVRNEIQRIHKRLGKPTIYVTHDQEEAMTMSDRIAVMSEGEIVQIGEPRSIYEHPTNMFIANFIGNPSINFIEGEVEDTTTQGGSVITATGVSLDFAKSAYFDSIRHDLEECVIGIRPQQIDIREHDTETPMTGTVQFVDYVDDRVHITLDTKVGEIVGVMSVEEALNEDEKASIDIDTDFFVFDRQSTNLIGKGPLENYSETSNMSMEDSTPPR